MYLKQTAGVALALVGATAAASSTIPLKAGDYGNTSLTCDNEPNAGTVSFDGRNFRYPHAARCTDTVRDRSSGVLRISETCRADGDGSPARAATEQLKIRVIGADRFQKIEASGVTTYRRCGALGYFEKH